jgi:hypothetical protein
MPSGTVSHQRDCEHSRDGAVPGIEDGMPRREEGFELGYVVVRPSIQVQASDEPATCERERPIKANVTAHPLQRLYLLLRLRAHQRSQGPLNRHNRGPFACVARYDIGLTSIRLLGTIVVSRARVRRECHARLLVWRRRAGRQLVYLLKGKVIAGVLAVVGFLHDLIRKSAGIRWMQASILPGQNPFTKVA